MHLQYYRFMWIKPSTTNAIYLPVALRILLLVTVKFTEIPSEAAEILYN